MKAQIKETTNFKPFTIEIEIETLNDLDNLYDKLGDLSNFPFSVWKELEFIIEKYKDKR